MEKIEAKDLLVNDVVVIKTVGNEDLKDVEGTIVQILCVDLPFIVGLDLAAHPESVGRLIWKDCEATLAVPCMHYARTMLHPDRRETVLSAYGYNDPLGEHLMRVRATKANNDTLAGIKEDKYWVKLGRKADAKFKDILEKEAKQRMKEDPTGSKFVSVQWYGDDAFHKAFQDAERNLVKGAYEKMMGNIERSFYFSRGALDENKK